MSLFKSREWWSVNLNENALYDSQCLLVSIIGKDRYQSVVLGNHEGLFRVFAPSSGLTEKGDVIGYKPSDLLMEIQFPSPILQMACGTFVSGCHEKNLAVLHPRLFTVYTFNRKESDNSLTDVVVLDTAYQHQLRHSAHSFIVGPFGGGRGRDFICIQSLDGLLSFYEQESFAFQLYLPDFLLPSPFAYVGRIDCFLFLNSSLAIDCYSYENLASQSDPDNPKKMLKYWSYNLGEGILDMRPVTSDQCNIVVLTARNLYNLSDAGKLIFMKRLEYRPMAFHVFVTAESKKLLILIAGDDYLLNIYEGTCLRWSTKIDQIPVAIDRIILSNLYGGIVLLSENGYLQCIYLGTHPSIYLMPPMNRPEVNIQETEAELKKLHKEISERDLPEMTEIDLVGVVLTVDSNLTEEDSKEICRISTEIKNQTPINRIQVLFIVDQPLATSVRSCLVSCCDRTTVESSVFLADAGPVWNLSVKAFVSYLNSNGTPYVIERQAKLPLSLVLEKTNPAKEAKCRITIVTDKPVCPLNALLREFAGEDANPNVIGLKYKNSDITVTILAAKTSQRYRLQSDHPEGISLVLSALVDRLRKYFHGSDVSISYDTALPLQVYFEEIERYHALLERRRVARVKLSKRTGQYRTVQKKVLVNLKDVTPKPISNLFNILRDTYEMIISSISELDGIEEELQTVRLRINALTALLIALMELMTIGTTDLSYLKTVFSGNVYDSDDQGWLEVQYAAATYFLRTTLAKSVRDQQKPTEIVLDPVTNVSKTLKSFSSIIDRVTKGTHLLERSEFEHDKELIATIPGAEEVDINDSFQIPEGSRLTELPDFSSGSRKDKRLMKQERVDSLGTIGSSTQEEDQEEIGSHQNRKSSFDSVQDDAIWDVKVDEMRI